MSIVPFQWKKKFESHGKFTQSCLLYFWSRTKINYCTLYANLQGNSLKLVLEQTSLLHSNSCVCCTGLTAQRKMWLWVNLVLCDTFKKKNTTWSSKHCLLICSCSCLLTARNNYYFSFSAASCEPGSLVDSWGLLVYFFHRVKRNLGSTG